MIINKMVAISLARLSDEAKEKFTAETGVSPDQVPVFLYPVDVRVSLRDFDDDEIENYYAEHFDDDTPRPWVERVYAALAAGDCKEAMDLMHREFGLAAPSHECAIADLIAGRKGTAHV